MNSFSAAPKHSFNNPLLVRKAHKLFGAVEEGYSYIPPSSATFPTGPRDGALLLLSGCSPASVGAFSNSAARRFLESICRCVSSLSHQLLVRSSNFARLSSGLLRIIDGAVIDGIVRRCPPLVLTSKPDCHGWHFISCFLLAFWSGAFNEKGVLEL